MSFISKNTWERRGRYLAALLLIIGAAIFVSRFDVGNLAIFLQTHEKVGIFICPFVYLLLGLTLIPSEPVTLLVLAWKGPLLAILLATLGNTLAVIAEYFLGNGIKDLTDFEKKKEKLPFHLGHLPINSPVFLIFARMLPGYGSKIVSLACGVYHVPMIKYVWTAVVSNLVGAALVALGGTGLIHLIK
jgi:uncharacterized membrane protein YdjX (TVP38/TMEM64 family)